METQFDPSAIPPGAIAKVKVDRKGRIYLDGKTVSLDELKAEFARVRRARGAVFYYREAPDAEPPPEVTAVIRSVVKAIAAERLPVRLEEKDFE